MPIVRRSKRFWPMSRGMALIALRFWAISWATGPTPNGAAKRRPSLLQAERFACRATTTTLHRGAGEAMSTLARRAMDWTRTRLSDAHRKFLASLPLTVAEGDLLYVHASANHPEAWSYVTSDTRATPSFRASKARLILCGHVHVPLLASCDRGGMVRQQVFRTGLPIPLLRSRRWLAVVGSVGQPRDGVPQAAWALVDTLRNDLTFRRTPYDVAKAADRVRAAGLPEDLATRLLIGK